MERLIKGVSVLKACADPENYSRGRGVRRLFEFDLGSKFYNVNKFEFYREEEVGAGHDKEFSDKL